MTKQDTLALQRSLNQSGFAYQISGETLKEDGIYGPATDRVYRAWLDRDTSVPTVTPPPAKPWWASRALMGLLASMLAATASRFGWSLDDGAITEVLLKAVEIGGLIVAAWGTMQRQGAIDPTLVARLGARDLRLPVRTQSSAFIAAGDPDPRGVFRDS